MRKRLIRACSVLIIAFAITIALHIQQTNKYKDWVSTNGVLYNVEEVNARYSRFGNSASYRLHYTYEVDGIEYTGADAYSGKLPDHYYIGQPVEVLYDTNEPYASLHERPKSELITRIQIMWSIPIALMLLLPMKKRTKRKEKQEFWAEMEKRGMNKEETINILNKWKGK